MKKLNLNIVGRFRSIMAAVYIVVGLLLIFDDKFAAFLEGYFRIAFAVVVIGYGAVRIYFTFLKSNKNQDSGISRVLILFFVSSSILFGCKNAIKRELGEDQSPTIFVDATLEPVISEELYVFSAMEGAQINVNYVPEEVAVNKLLKDSTSLVILAGQLKPNEIRFLNQRSYYPKTTKIAVDAIAFIANKNKDSLNLTLSQVQDIIGGKITSWKSVDRSYLDEPIQVVFDNKESSTMRFMIDSVCGSKELGKNIYALEENKQVIDYVSKNRNALGIIGVSWISDRNDSLHLSFHEMISVVSVSNKYNQEAYYKPYQAYMYDGVYPFTREIYVINNEPFNGVLSRLASFLANDKGQRILYKAGLFPANAPIRLIQVNTEM